MKSPTLSYSTALALVTPIIPVSLSLCLRTETRRAPRIDACVKPIGQNSRNACKTCWMVFLTPGDSWVCGFVVWSALYLAQFMWARRLRASGDAAAKECDAANSTAPRVAFCISGLARSFATPFMLDQHWQLLVRPLAPDASDRKADHGHRIFFHLKSDRSSQLARSPPAYRQYCSPSSEDGRAPCWARLWSSTGVAR